MLCLPPRLRPYPSRCRRWKRQGSRVQRPRPLHQDHRQARRRPRSLPGILRVHPGNHRVQGFLLRFLRHHHGRSPRQQEHELLLEVGCRPGGDHRSRRHLLPVRHRQEEDDDAVRKGQGRPVVQGNRRLLEEDLPAGGWKGLLQGSFLQRAEGNRRCFGARPLRRVEKGAFRISDHLDLSIGSKFHRKFTSLLYY